MNNYQQLHKIGEGVYGTVHKYRDNSHANRLVAIKSAKSDQAEGVPATSIREVSILKKLSSPHIVKLLHAAYDCTSSLYLVFELMETDLRKYIRNFSSKKGEKITLPIQSKLARMGLGEDTVRKFLKQLLEGVSHCHAQRILHRDLKPENMLIDFDGNLKLADFGLAREFSTVAQAYTREVVTLWYRALEILVGSPTYSTEIDMWSVGCVFAEMCTQDAVFKGTSELNQVAIICSKLGLSNDNYSLNIDHLQEYSQITDTNQSYSNRLSDIPKVDSNGLDLLRKLLECNPTKRISAAEACQHAYFGP